MDKTILKFAKRLYEIRKSVKKYIERNAAEQTGSGDELKDEIDKLKDWCAEILDKEYDKMLGLDWPDSEEDCIKYLYDNLTGKDRGISRKLLKIVYYWHEVLRHEAKPYYTKTGAGVLRLNAPDRAKKAYILKRRIDRFVKDIMKYEASQTRVVLAYDKS